MVKPAFRFAFVVNSFHKDLFSEWDPRGSSISKRDILLFSEEPARTTPGAFLAGFFSPEIIIQFWISLDSMNMKKTRENTRRRVHKVSARNV